MKVLLYTDSDGLGGIERHICDLAAALPADDVDAAVVCRRSSELERAALARGLNVLSLPTGRPYALRASRQLASWVAANGADVIHAHNGRAAMISVIATRLAGRAVCVKSQHFLEPAHVARRGPFSVMTRAVHRRVNAEIHSWIAVSEAARARMLDRREAPPERVTVIHNGIREPQPGSLTEPAAIRRQLHVDAEAPLAVCVARLEPEKDIPTLIGAWRHVAAAMPHARCVLVGAGSDEAALKGHVRQVGLEEAVLFAGFRSDAPSVINAADLLVLSSLSESFGLVLLEAMSLSKAVVSTRIGGPAEIVREGQTGFLVPTSDAPALADAILKLLGDRDLREEFGRNGRNRFAQEFTTERMARATVNIYRAAVGDHLVSSTPVTL
jgi:glycosyltransferase involved in cell wall biosynthesis